MSSEKKMDNLLPIPNNNDNNNDDEDHNDLRQNLWKLAVFDVRRAPDLGNDENAASGIMKDEETIILLQQAINKVLFFSTLDNEEKNMIMGKMWTQEVEQDECLIQKGKSADHFCIIEKGEFEVLPVNKKLSRGDRFGELALMHSMPQRITIKALCKSTVWTISRNLVKKIMIDTSARKHEELLRFLQNMNIFKSLNPRKIGILSQALEVEKFNSGEEIITQGKFSSKFYIIRKGTVTVSVMEEADALALPKYIPGDYFGERELLNGDERAATYVAVGNVEVLTLRKAAFVLLVEPMTETFQKREDEFQKSISIARESVQKARAVSDAIVEAKTSETVVEVGGAKKAEDLNDTDVNQLDYSKLLFRDLNIVGTLGRGAFGHVQLMTDEKTVPGRKIVHACKTVNKALLHELKQVDHVMSEKTVMEMLNHSFLIKLRHTFNEKDSLHFMLEPCYGGELKSILAEKEYLETDIAVFIAACVLIAIKYLHSQGITFRDLKPENILLTSGGYIKLADFGFAKQIGDGKTYTLCGTPDYLAPEVVAAQGHDKNVDYWTIGILIYEMLVGEPPFWDDNPMGIYQNIMRGNIEFPEELETDDVDVIKQFLSKVSERLGATAEGFQAIKDHKWFASFDWDACEKREMTPPECLIRPVSNELDLSNFEDLLGEDDRWRLWDPEIELEDDEEDPFGSF